MTRQGMPLGIALKRRRRGCLIFIPINYFRLSAKNIHPPGYTECQERMVAIYRAIGIAVLAPCKAIGTVEAHVFALLDGEVLNARTYA
jgi:hypothetical protein